MSYVRTGKEAGAAQVKMQRNGGGMPTTRGRIGEKASTTQERHETLND